jgi:hypothetical protein
MLVDVTGFECFVNRSGYMWSDDRGVAFNNPNAPHEIMLVPIDRSGTLDPIRPLDIVGLFNIFGDTEPTQPGIQDFANRYGLLSSFFFPYEMSMELSDWVDEISKMRDAIILWDRYLNQDGANADQLAKLIQANLTGLRTFPEVGEDGKIQFLLKPWSLLNAIWLQFSQAVEDGNWRNCERCNTRFQFKRKSKRWCSDSCKQAISDIKRGVR